MEVFKMARTPRKTVYERITEKQQKIKETEELLQQLNIELKELYSEKDDLEMRTLLAAMKERNLDIEQAVKMLHGEKKSTK